MPPSPTGRAIVGFIESQSMDLLDVWPLFGLTLTSPRLTLRIVRDDDIPALLEAAYPGIHDLARMPFMVPWTDAEPDQMRRDFARRQWRQQISVQPGNWVVRSRSPHASHSAN